MNYRSRYDKEQNQRLRKRQRRFSRTDKKIEGINENNLS